MTTLDELRERLDGMIGSAEGCRDKFGVDQSHSWAQMHGRYLALVEVRALLSALQEKESTE